MIETMVPPAELNFVGDGSFLEIGREFLQHFIRVGGLKPHHHVLDAGCGIGRMAIPLTQYLSREGSYEGFDIVDVGVIWCQQHITPRHPNFRFQKANVYNRTYNRRGRMEACDYAFPYADESFDFIFLTSVFTHMLPPDFEHYLAEIARTLKLNGRCFSTYFLHNADSARLMSEGKAHLNFVPKKDYWTTNPRVPEDAICLSESYVAEQYARLGMQIEMPIYHGCWSGRAEGLTMHDVVVATKTESVRMPANKRTASRGVVHHVAGRLVMPWLRRQLRRRD